MAPLTGYHRTPLPPTGVSHAVSCRLFPQTSTPSSTQSSSPSHLITARDNTLSIYEISGEPCQLSHLKTHKLLHGSISSLSVVKTLQTKRDGKDRILISFEQAKMSLMEWDEQLFDLISISLHTFEKLPQLVAGQTLLAHDPNSRMTVLHLPTNSGGDGTLAVLPWFTEELDLEGLGMDRIGWEQGGSQIPYAPSHLIPLTSLQPTVIPTTSSSLATRSSTLPSSSTTSNVNAFLPNQPPPIRNLISMTFLPGFTEPTLAILYAPDYTWSGRLEHLAHNHLVSLITLSTRSTSSTTSDSTSSTSTTQATLISTSPPLPYSLLSIQSIPTHLGIGSVLLKSSNGLLLLDIQGGKLSGVETNDWFKKDFPPGRPLPSGITGGGDNVGECLEGSVIKFIDSTNETEQEEEDEGEARVGSEGLENSAIIFCKSGKILILSIERIGRSIGGLSIEPLSSSLEEGRGGVSCLVRINQGRNNKLLFVGGEQINSRLYKIESDTREGGGGIKKEIDLSSTLTQGNAEKGKEDEEDEEMDDDDEDIYGDSTNKTSNSSKNLPKFDSNLLSGALESLNSLVNSSSTPTTTTKGNSLRLKLMDELESYGSIRSLVMGLIDEQSSIELVGATGAGKQAGLTIFHRTLPTTHQKTFNLPTSITSNGNGEVEREGEGGRNDFQPIDGIWNLNLGPKLDQLGGGSEEILIGSNSNQGGTYFYKTINEELQLVKIEQDFQSLYACVMGGNGGEGVIIVLIGTEEIKVYDRDLNPLQSVVLKPSIQNNNSARASSTENYLALHVGRGGSSLSLLYKYDSDSTSLLEIQAFEDGTKITVWKDSEKNGILVRPVIEKHELNSRLSNGGGGDDDDEMREMERERQQAQVEQDEDEDLYGTSSSSTDNKAVPKVVKMEIETEQEQQEEKNGIIKTEKIKRDERFVENEEIGNESREWLVKIDQQGTLTIHLLPTMMEVFKAQSVSLFPSVLSDSPGSEPSTIPSSIDPDDLVIDRIQLHTLGTGTDKKLHLILWNSSGTLVFYEAFPAKAPTTTTTTTEDQELPPAPRLGLRFVKTLVNHVPISIPRRKGQTDLPPPIRKELIPFDGLSRSPRQGFSGVFLTGEESYWFLKNRKSNVRSFESNRKGIYAFSPSETSDYGNFLTFTLQQGLELSRIPETSCINFELPLTFIRKGRVYSYLSFDLDSGLYVAGSLNQTNFVAFDDEGVPVFKETSPGLLEPKNYQSTLELLVPGTWQAIDGYEFRQNEFVCTVKSVSLHSKSRANGMRDFIAVGTTVYRGEDLSAKGGIYIFEVIKVVPDPEKPRQDHVLKLRFFEDTKSIVGNVCDLNGYLFLSMGQKLYARAFEQDEVLIAVGFLDLGVHVTSLTALKNFLLIGDAMQSVALVAFQEDPYKLVFLGRDYRPSRIASANFLVNEGRVAFVTGDDKGVLRMFEYDPSNIASHAGQRLLCRTEYHAGSESISTMLFAKHSLNEDPKQNGILFGGIDGSIYTLVPVRDAVFKRLQSLQSTMTRHVLHFGGLNPRGYRIVKNDTVSRAITKGILDGDLLSKFEYLSVDVQTELAKVCGTDVDTVLANLRNLRVYE
ncbi:hypothetical protein JCM3765_000915 [Sporobolomyces pararoseus]